MNKLKIAVLASGNGSNLQAILEACQAGKINGEVVVVVSNKHEAFALKRAQKNVIETAVFDPKEFQTPLVMCSSLAKFLKERKVDLVVLAGYMLKLEPCMIRSFPKRIINIHPALLPKYGGAGMFGRHVHEAVLDAKEKTTGASVHVVDEIFDNGPILAQREMNVEEKDTPESLANRLHPLEHALYVEVIGKIANGEIDLSSVTQPARHPGLDPGSKTE